MKQARFGLILAAGLLATCPAFGQSDPCVPNKTYVVIENGKLYADAIVPLGCSRVRAMEIAIDAVFSELKDRIAEQVKPSTQQMIKTEHEQFKGFANCTLGQPVGDGCPSPQGPEKFVPAGTQR
ncbi:MAG TPA: hypothetical protein VMH91_03035 [Candidatus Paceibacterota bacterium]|nr:hypothetical protein [Candidatus Paceibacterota bacterium]